MKFYSSFAAVAVALVLFVAQPGYAQDQSIAELAVATPTLSTLVAALTAADLVDTFSGEGTFTVFAPTDAAFATLLSSKGLTADQLLASDDLAKILQYHVLPSKVRTYDQSCRRQSVKLMLPKLSSISSYRAQQCSASLSDVRPSLVCRDSTGLLTYSKTCSKPAASFTRSCVAT